MTSRLSAITCCVFYCATFAACAPDVENAAYQTAPADASVQTDTTVIPQSLAPFGDGYPSPGDPCRRLGESAATSNFLDDSAILVGCPSPAAAAALRANIVATIGGVTLVSVATGDANAGMR